MAEITEESMIRVKSDHGVVRAYSVAEAVIVQRFSVTGAVIDAYQLTLGQADALAHQLDAARSRAKVAQMTRRQEDVRNDGLVQSRFE